MKTLLASLGAVAMLTACEDLFEDGSLQPDGSKPSLTINSPVNNQLLSSGSTLRVSITAVDKDQVQDLEFSLSPQESTGQPLVQFLKHPQRNVVEFDTTFALKNVAPGNYTLTISAKDKRTNLSEQQVTIKLK